MSLLLVFTRGVSLVYGRDYFLKVLLRLELMMLSIFFILASISLSFLLEYFIIFIVVVVCEARLGLAILIVCILHFGSDYVAGSSFLNC